MKNGIQSFVLTFILGALALPSWGASVQLVPQLDSVQMGNDFLVDVLFDPTGAPGNNPGSFSGMAKITWDSTLAELNGLPVDTPSYTSISSGLGFLSFMLSAPGEQLITTITFKSLLTEVDETLPWEQPGYNGEEGGNNNGGGGRSGPINVITLDIQDAFPSIGTFVNTSPTNQPFTPDFEGADVSVVPLPAAAWLMLSGLGVIGAWSRIKKSNSLTGN